MAIEFSQGIEALKVFEGRIKKYHPATTHNNKTTDALTLELSCFWVRLPISLTKIFLSLPSISMARGTGKPGLESAYSSMGFSTFLNWKAPSEVRW
jgi:hypothetical protein